MYSSHWFGGGFMWIFWVSLIVLVAWFLKTSSSQNASQRSPEDSALEILKQRYARGEIDQREYEKKRRDLES